LPITLGQFVKLAGFVATGGDAKLTVTSGHVTVNGEIEARRGRKLAFGDVVRTGDEEAVVAPRGETSGTIPGPSEPLGE
jgi:ribosome-associated protein